MQVHLKDLLESVENAKRVLILTHNDPDPDGIASAVALKHLLTKVLGLDVEIIYQGIIGRAENKALIEYLGTPLRHIKKIDFDGNPALALVDTQPGAGNNPLIPNIVPRIVIDHHPLHENTGQAAFVDVSPDTGACATILTSYLRAANIEPQPGLATALFYGIKTDTQGLGRHATQADVDSYFYLQPLIDIELLFEIEQAQVPIDYFKGLAATLHAARIYDDIVFAYIGETCYPDMAAEMADRLLRLEKTRWVICMNEYRNELVVSVRTRQPSGGAEIFIQSIVGKLGSAGGHGMMAGGQIPLRDKTADEMAELLRKRALAYFNIPTDLAGKNLV